MRQSKCSLIIMVLSLVVKVLIRLYYVDMSTQPSIVPCLTFFKILYIARFLYLWLISMANYSLLLSVAHIIHFLYMYFIVVTDYWGYFLNMFVLGVLLTLYLFPIQDPCRPGVKNAVQLCKNAGVKVSNSSFLNI